MYIDLGQNAVFSHKDIIGIFDLDTATVSKQTRDYLAKAEKNKEITSVSLLELPASFTVCATDKTSQRVYLSPLGTSSIAKKGL